jgi:hypothetical protein
MFSILSLYRWNLKIQVDYESPDDELAVNVLNSLTEFPRLCALMVMGQSFQPHAIPLGKAFVDLSAQVSDIYWGALRILSMPPKEPTEVEALQGRKFKSVPYNTRVIEISEWRPVDNQSHACKAWVLARELIINEGTLVSIPATCLWEDVPIKRTGADLLSTSMRHHSKDIPKALA